MISCPSPCVPLHTGSKPPAANSMVANTHLLPGVVAFGRMVTKTPMTMAACGEFFTLLLATNRDVCVHL